MRSPACLAVLCLAACACRGEALRNRAAAEAALQQAPLPEGRQKRVAALQRWMWNGLLTVAQHGKQLAPILFGKDSQSTNTLFSQEEGFESGCSAADGSAAKAAFVNWQTKFLAYEEEVVHELHPLVGNMTVGPTGQPSVGDMLKVQKAMDKTWKQIAREFPGVCRNVESLVREGKALACAYQATNVSKKCLRCIPRYFRQLSSGCGGGCESNMLELANGMKEVSQSLLGDMMSPESLGDIASTGAKSAKSAERMAEVSDKMVGALKKIVPCAQCARKKTAVLLDCFNLDDAWKADADSALGEFIDMLKSGSISVSTDGGMPSEQQPQQQPPVPMM